jgi:hypothetical protein
MPAPDYILPIDIGQAADFTALGGLKRLPVPTGKEKETYVRGGPEMAREYDDTFQLGYAHRFPLHTPYPEIIHELAQVCHRIPGSFQVVADATGVGRPVVDMMRDAGLPVVGVIITAGAGAAVHDKETGYWKVPKRELVTRGQTYLQTGRLKISSKLKLADVIVKEMLAFKMKISSSTGNVSFEAWRDAAHDDLVLMLCMGVWWGHVTRTGWKKDQGPMSGHDKRMRDAARDHFSLDEDVDWPG